jgi:hypothetical protein
MLRKITAYLVQLFHLLFADVGQYSTGFDPLQVRISRCEFHGICIAALPWRNGGVPPARWRSSTYVWTKNTTNLLTGDDPLNSFGGGIHRSFCGFSDFRRFSAFSTPMLGCCGLFTERAPAYGPSIPFNTSDLLRLQVASIARFVLGSRSTATSAPRGLLHGSGVALFPCGRRSRPPSVLRRSAPKVTDGGSPTKTCIKRTTRLPLEWPRRRVRARPARCQLCNRHRRIFAGSGGQLVKGLRLGEAFDFFSDHGP